MRITHISVRNYRCLAHLDLDVSDYTALVGANGAGKSSMLYALDWFFNGNTLDASDITRANHLQPDERLEVAVTFGNLTDFDRQRLGEYGRGDIARFRRSWVKDDKNSKVVGRALEGPGFGDVRRESRVTDMRKGYQALQQRTAGLPHLAGNAPKDDILDALTQWESEPGNEHLLVAVDDADANHMFGINGPNIIRECVQFVLVPAATDIGNQLRHAGKGTVLSDLIGAVIADAGRAARDQWLDEHHEVIASLNDTIRSGVETSVARQASYVNQVLTSMIPNAQVGFVPTLPDWSPKSDPTVNTSVTIDGITNDVDRQGHGVQRAVMIALLQSLVPAVLDSQDDVQGNEFAPTTVRSGPALVVCIEEPEIYQHPIRARLFARVLSELAEQPHAQVLIATHSPYFVAPKKFDSIRRFHMQSGIAVPAQTSVSSVATAANNTNDAVQKIVDKRLPTTFSEGFFARAVVLVEGDTDRAVLENLALRLGSSLDERGVSLIELGGKEGLRIPYSIFTELGIPAFVIADGDADRAERRYPDANKEEDRARARASHQSSTENLLAWLPDSTALRGTRPYQFGDPTIITETYALWRDDLEAELSAWPSFVAKLDETGGKLRHKDAMKYRLAVLEADLMDVPDTLKLLIETIAAFPKS